MKLTLEKAVILLGVLTIMLSIRTYASECTVTAATTPTLHYSTSFLTQKNPNNFPKSSDEQNQYISPKIIQSAYQVFSFEPTSVILSITSFSHTQIQNFLPGKEEINLSVYLKNLHHHIISKQAP